MIRTTLLLAALAVMVLGCRDRPNEPGATVPPRTTTPAPTAPRPDDRPPPGAGEKGEIRVDVPGVNVDVERDKKNKKVDVKVNTNP